MNESMMKRLWAEVNALDALYTTISETHYSENEKSSEDGKTAHKAETASKRVPGMLLRLAETLCASAAVVGEYAASLTAEDALSKNLRDDSTAEHDDYDDACFLCEEDNVCWMDNRMVLKYPGDKVRICSYDDVIMTNLHPGSGDEIVRSTVCGNLKLLYRNKDLWTLDGKKYICGPVAIGYFAPEDGSNGDLANDEIILARDYLNRHEVLFKVSKGTEIKLFQIENE